MPHYLNPEPPPLTPRPKKQDIKHKHIWLPLSFLSVSIAMSMMSLNTKHSYKLSVKRATRRVRKQQRRTTTPSVCKSPRIFKPIMESKLSQKLQALKNLIPANNGVDIVKPDQLFQETADYIVLLRTRVVILHKLIEFYGNNPEDESAILL